MKERKIWTTKWKCFTKAPFEGLEFACNRECGEHTFSTAMIPEFFFPLFSFHRYVNSSMTLKLKTKGILLIGKKTIVSLS